VFFDRVLVHVRQESDTRFGGRTARLPKVIRLLTRAASDCPHCLVNRTASWRPAPNRTPRPPRLERYIRAAMPPVSPHTRLIHPSLATNHAGHLFRRRRSLRSTRLRRHHHGRARVRDETAAGRRASGWPRGAVYRNARPYRPKEHHYRPNNGVQLGGYCQPQQGEEEGERNQAQIGHGELDASPYN
jgi:hypothetical protein